LRTLSLLLFMLCRCLGGYRLSLVIRQPIRCTGIE